MIDDFVVVDGDDMIGDFVFVDGEPNFVLWKRMSGDLKHNDKFFLSPENDSSVSLNFKKNEGNNRFEARNLLPIPEFPTVTSITPDEEQTLKHDTNITEEHKKIFALKAKTPFMYGLIAEAIIDVVFGFAVSKQKPSPSDEGYDTQPGKTNIIKQLEAGYSPWDIVSALRNCFATYTQQLDATKTSPSQKVFYTILLYRGAH